MLTKGLKYRVRQILTNLLTNSIKFTSEGFVKLSAEVSDETNDSIEVLFSVEDSGIGIEEDVRKRLFKPFSQADSSTARRFGGTGLGLTICKNVSNENLMIGGLDAMLISCSWSTSCMARSHLILLLAVGPKQNSPYLLVNLSSAVACLLLLIFDLSRIG